MLRSCVSLILVLSLAAAGVAVPAARARAQVTTALGDPARPAPEEGALRIDPPSPAESIVPVIGVVLGGLVLAAGVIALIPAAIEAEGLDLGIGRDETMVAITLGGAGAAILGALAFWGSLEWLGDIARRRRLAERSAAPERVLLAPTRDGALAGARWRF